eukprot:TRINITY_DN60193_c0_g1_i1.p1 TRINITY_DN60193_c0_g1~~TRINITY_DN60193_c0_g1_i1.p1  ORF type:complete len:900 (+),score=211.81 TRINITY_DN60193_c0_g1_i1:75-2774(+)
MASMSPDSELAAVCPSPSGAASPGRLHRSYSAGDAACAQPIFAPSWSPPPPPGVETRGSHGARLVGVICAAAVIAGSAAALVGYAAGRDSGLASCHAAPAAEPQPSGPRAAACTAGWPSPQCAPGEVDADGASALALSGLDPSVHGLLPRMSAVQKAGALTIAPAGELLAAAAGESLAAVVGAPRWTGGWAWSPELGVPSQPAQTWRTAAQRAHDAAVAEGATPPLLATDGSQGAGGVVGAAAFPAPINVAATFDPGSAATVAEVAAKDARAAGFSVLVAPRVGACWGIAAWPSLDSCYGEDPLLAAALAAAYVKAAQGTSGGNLSSPAACAAAPVVDHRTAPEGDAGLLTALLAPAEAVVAAGAAALVVAGAGAVTARKLVTGLLRTLAGFDGPVVSSWGAVDATAAAAGNAPQAAVELLLGGEADVDAALSPQRGWAAGLRAAGGVLPPNASAARLSAAAGRVLELKLRAGLLSGPDPLAASAHLAADHPVGSHADRRASLLAAERSVVLLRNAGGLLPLKADARVLLTGPAADSLALLCRHELRSPEAAFAEGDWTLRRSLRELHTGCDRFLDMAPHTCNAARGCRCLHQHSFNGVLRCIDCRPVPDSDPAAPFRFAQGLWENGTDAGVSDAVREARDADVVVVALSEPLNGHPTAELPRTQRALLAALTATPAQVVAVLVSGRPLLLGGEEAAAVLWAGLPGPEGAFALAEVLVGEVSPSGRLPFTYPSSALGLRPYWDPAAACGVNCGVEWPFGWGLQYDNWAYTGITVSPAAVTLAQLRGGSTVTVNVTVQRQRGARVADPAVHSVLLFASRGTAPSGRLRAFGSVAAASGETAEAQFELGLRDLGDPAGGSPEVVLPPGLLTLSAAASGLDCVLLEPCLAGCGVCTHLRIDT